MILICTYEYRTGKLEFCCSKSFTSYIFTPLFGEEDLKNKIHL